MVDNQAAVQMSMNDKLNKLTRHISRRFHYVREGVKRGLHRLFWIPKEDQLSDILTKTQPATVINPLLNRAMFRLPTFLSNPSYAQIVSGQRNSRGVSGITLKLDWLEWDSRFQSIWSTRIIIWSSRIEFHFALTIASQQHFRCWRVSFGSLKGIQREVITSINPVSGKDTLQHGQESSRYISTRFLRTHRKIIEMEGPLPSCSQFSLDKHWLYSGFSIVYQQTTD